MAGPVAPEPILHTPDPASRPRDACLGPAGSETLCNTGSNSDIPQKGKIFSRPQMASGLSIQQRALLLTSREKGEPVSSLAHGSQC